MGIKVATVAPSDCHCETCQLRRENRVLRDQIHKLETLLDAYKEKEFPLIPSGRVFRDNDPHYNIEVVKRAVARQYGLHVREIDMSSKAPPMRVRARFVAFYIARQLFRAQASYPYLGRMFGNRDHGTIFNGVRRIRETLDVDPRLRAEIADICLTLGVTLQDLLDKPEQEASDDGLVDSDTAGEA
jgi:chromosomal replication initiation ATPase DnaA